MNKFFKNLGPFALQDIVDEFKLTAYKDGKKIEGLSNIQATDVKTLEDADSESITFLFNKKYIDQFKQTKAKACITAESFVESAPKNVIILAAKNPYVTFAKIAAKFYKTAKEAENKISGNSYIDKTASIGKNTEIMSNVHVDSGAKIGKSVVIFPHCYIGKNVEIGDNCIIHHSVTIQNTIIGNDVNIHPGVRIGQDGFGFALDAAEYVKVPQIGSVIIGNDVEIGANCTIDRGTLHNTIIGDMSKIDNLVQIGHNVQLGKGSIIVAQAGVAGSTKIGNFVQIGGQAGIAGHLNVGDKAQIAGQSGVMSDLESGAVVMGTPSMPIKQFFRQIAKLKKLIEK